MLTRVQTQPSSHHMASAGLKVSGSPGTIMWIIFNRFAARSSRCCASCGLMSGEVADGGCWLGSAGGNGGDGASSLPLLALLSLLWLVSALVIA